MKIRHFALSPLLYALIAAGLAAELFLFFPNSYQAYAAHPDLDNLPLVAVDGLVVAALALLAAVTVTVSVGGGTLNLRVAGVTVRRLELADVESVAPSFPFLVFQKKERGKPRVCPAVIGRQAFLGALVKENPSIRVETGPKSQLK